MGYPTRGTNGDDTLIGRDKAHWELHDHILGRKGNDFLSGLLSRDNLEGGSGNDTLIGGKGDDVLAGNGREGKLGKDGTIKFQKDYGPGEDTFVFAVGDGHDVIVDLEVGIDHLVFLGVDPASIAFTVNFGIPPAFPESEGWGSNKHWGAAKYGVKEGYFTTITYDGGQIELVGVQAHSMDELNL